LFIFKLNVVQGTGRFVETPCFSDYVYKRVSIRDNVNIFQFIMKIKKYIFDSFILFFFKIKPVKVERDPYTGPVVELTTDVEAGFADMGKISPATNNNNPHARPLTKSGGRNMQDSSFSFGGGQWDDQPLRNGTKVHHPPGGKSSGIF
jgi:hypothetical protein